MTGCTTASPSLLTRLICGVQGPGDVEWRGMNMLTIGYDETDDAHHITIRPIDMTVGSPAGTCVSGKAGVDSSAVIYASADGQQATDRITRESVMESLRRRTDERLRRRYATDVGVRTTVRGSDTDGRSLA